MSEEHALDHIADAVDRLARATERWTEANREAIRQRTALDAAVMERLALDTEVARLQIRWYALQIEALERAKRDDEERSERIRASLATFSQRAPGDQPA